MMVEKRRGRANYDAHASLLKTKCAARRAYAGHLWPHETVARLSVVSPLAC